jgi:hypothetical protein
MKKAKIILTALVVLGTIAGALAFKAARFTGIQAYKTTNTISLIVGGRTYTATTAAGAFCTTIPVFATETEGVLVDAVVSTTLPAPRLVTLTATNGSTIGVLYPFCTTIFTITTVAP